MASASVALRAEVRNPQGLRRDRTARSIAVGVAVIFHVALLWLLLTHAPARNALRAMAPIVIDVIVPSTDPPRATPPPKPQVKPLQRAIPAHVEPPAIIGAPAEAPATFAAPPPPEPMPLPPAEAIVAPEPTPPVPLIPPRFDAAYLQNPVPPYPPLARRMREQGKVILRVLVDADGLPERVELRTSSGSARLDQSAQDTVKAWKFVAARQGERNVSAWVLVPITFTLEH